MGSVNIDNTGSGADVTLSSDGTDLLLDGTAIGGGGAASELYAENPSSPTAPSATGTNAVAIGSGADAFDTDSVSFGTDTAAGSRGVSIGPRAGLSSASGATGNVAIGWNAALYLTTGDENVAVGRSALQGSGLDLLTGSDNVGVGYGAGSKVSTGNANTMVGLSSGNAITSGSNNTFIGRNADGNANLSGQTGVGHNAATAGSNATALTNSYASGTDSFAAAIANNTSSYGATGSYSVATGRLAKASGNYSLAIGGYNSAASGVAAVSIGGNQANKAFGNASFCIGGYQAWNEASDDNSFAMGEGAKSAVKGKLAYAGGRFSSIGDAQGGQFILRSDTTDATATVLTTNNSTAGSTNQVVAASDTCITFDGTITAMQNGAQAYASWKIEGLLVNDGGTTTLANSATTVISNGSSWGMALSADNTNNALAITATGEASHNIRWVANIRTTEVTYA